MLRVNKKPTTQTALAHDASSDRLEWLRVDEARAFSRLSKAKLYDLINRGLIKSVSLKERNQIKGTRLISNDSLRAFLESRATGGETLGNRTA